MDYLKILCALQRCYIDNEFIIWIASSYYMDKDIITWNCSIISGHLIFHLESLFLGDTVLYGALLLPRVINWNYYCLEWTRDVIIWIQSLSCGTVILWRTILMMIILDLDLL